MLNIVLLQVFKKILLMKQSELEIELFRHEPLTGPELCGPVTGRLCLGAIKVGKGPEVTLLGELQETLW